MTISAPVILLPTAGVNYTTDIEIQTLSGTTSLDTAEIQVNGSTFGVSYTPGESVWAWTGTLVLGENILSIIAIEETTLVPSLPATITITLIENITSVTVSPPTGVRVRQYQDKIEAVNIKNTEVNTLGYNYYVSTQSGGINNTYAKINTVLVTEYSFYEDDTTELSSVTDTVGNIRVTTTTEEVTRNYYYSYFLDLARYQELVTDGSLPAVTFGEGTPFFFVITAVIYDSVLGIVTESSHSIELEGTPITITTGIKDIPGRTQNDIILTFSQELLTGNQGIDTKPGTVIRDIMDPISEEMARIYIIQNFLAISMSISGLLDFDDADGNGVSDPVSTSVPKRALKVALNLTNDSDVQQIIDSQFDKLASNVNVTRRSATAAIGSVTFYTSTAPIRNMIINEGGVVSSTGDLDQGIASQSYLTQTSKILEYADRDKYYNEQTGRYEVSVDVQALTSGEASNTDSYTIKTVSSGIDSDFQVENANPVTFGRDIESNHDLATRTELALFADTGTEGGYAKTAANVQGVRNVHVEKAGDSLMIRDYDSVRDKHVGGKVDIYIQGKQSKQVTDQIAFSFESISSQGTQSGEVFTILNAISYQFKTKNTRVTAHTPIFEVSRVYNVTRSADYDISGYQIIGDGDTIDLDETKSKNVAIGLAANDQIRVDYKFRSSDTFILQYQPVLDIVSVRGQLSGELTSDNWELVKLQDPLAEGGSTIASDSIRIKFANNLPVTEFQTISDEAHVLILDKEEALNYLGADTESILVKNTAKTIVYTENVDYRVSPGTDTTPTTILIIETGSLSNGQEVLISYTAIENFIITYTTNSLLTTVQNDVNVLKHACADVIVKQAPESEVDFAFTIVPKTGVTNTSLLTTKIATAVSNFVTQLGVGKSLTQSDIVQVIKPIADVDYIIIPFTRMVKADGSLVVRDSVGRTQFEFYHEDVVKAYISATSVLSFNTMDKGGPENYFRGIFENSLPLVLQDDPLYVSGAAGRGYIMEDGKIVVSTKDGTLPDTKYYDVAYYVYGETGSKDIEVTSTESLTVGTLTVSYDTARQSSL